MASINVLGWLVQVGGTVVKRHSVRVSGPGVVVLLLPGSLRCRRLWLWMRKRSRSRLLGSFGGDVVFIGGWMTGDETGECVGWSKVLGLAWLDVELVSM